MDTSSLRKQSISLHKEIEDIGQAQRILKAKLFSLNQRKKIVKKAIDKNLKKQAVIWDTEKILKSELVDPILAGMNALEDFIYNPDQTLKEVSDRHNINETTLSYQISNHLRIA